MLRQFLLYSKVTQLYIHIYLLFFRFFSHTGHYRVLSKSSLRYTIGPYQFQHLSIKVCTLATSNNLLVPLFFSQENPPLEPCLFVLSLLAAAQPATGDPAQCSPVSSLCSAAAVLRVLLPLEQVLSKVPQKGHGK